MRRTFLAIALPVLLASLVAVAILLWPIATQVRGYVAIERMERMVADGRLNGKTLAEAEQMLKVGPPKPWGDDSLDYAFTQGSFFTVVYLRVEVRENRITNTTLIYD